MPDIERIVESQKEFFRSGKTLDVDFRIQMLKRLYEVIDKHEDRINKAMQKDLGKSVYESYMCEVGLSKAEISYLIRHVKSFSKEKRVHTPLSQFLSRSFVLPSPRGTCLILSPWNYPFMLTIEPLADAIAAGNTIILKPSESTPEVSAAMEEMLKEAFDENYVAMVRGDHALATRLLEQKLDFIFFTGSKRVGQMILERAAANLTPCVLELGGKSPCIVEKTADIPLAARRIVFGKYLNCGQTCVAPDYILCDKAIKPALLEALKKEILRQYGEDPLSNPDYGKIINAKHYDRLMAHIQKGKVAFGGKGDREDEKIEPTILDDVTLESSIMGEEIFGPILPILTYENYDEVFDIIDKNPTPLALYIFSCDKKIIRTTLRKVAFGGGCVNDVVIHLANSEMGFGGIGNSGMGAYHGKVGFDTFSHQKSIVDKKRIIDLPMRYQPYKSRLYERLLRFFLK